MSFSGKKSYVACARWSLAVTGSCALPAAAVCKMPGIQAVSPFEPRNMVEIIPWIFVKQMQARMNSPAVEHEIVLMTDLLGFCNLMGGVKVK